MRLALITAIVLPLSLGTVGSAAEKDSILFSDDFSAFDPAWGKQNDMLWIENKQLVIRSDRNSTYTQLNNRLKFGDADIRVKIRLAEGGSDRGAGIVFWAAGFENSYTAMIKADGQVDVHRRIDGEPLVINAPKVHSAVNQGTGQVNELRVVTKGQWAAVYVNGQKIWTFKGFPPAADSQFGLRGGSGDQPYTWQFSNLVVRKTDPALLPATPAGTDPSILYSDDFTIFDAGWGQPNDKMWVSGNKLNMQPAVDAYLMDLYAGAYLKDVDIRVKTRVAQGDLSGPAGVVFWAADLKNYYRVLLQPDGYLAVIRQTQESKQFVLPWSKHAAVDRGIGQVNELRVVTKGDWATLFVNDRPVLTFQGYPPKEPSLIGLIANSGNAWASQWQFFDLIVRKPDESLFRDAVLHAGDFSTPEPGWGDPDNNRYFQNNDFVLRPNPNHSYTQTYQGMTFRDVDVRAMVCEVSGQNDKTAGIVFWATDYHNGYVAVIRPDGYVSVVRSIDDRWLDIGPWKLQPTIKQGLRQWNELRVVTRGEWAAVYVNKEFVCKLRGFPPDGPSHVGFHANSGSEVYTWAFANFVVRKPDDSLLPAPAPWSATDPTVLFADRFQMLDPAWGVANDQLRAERNSLIIEPESERSYSPLYQGNFFGDCDIRVKISETRGGVDKPAGIVFWAADFANYYAAHFRSDGQFDVCRKKSGVWENVVEAKIADPVKRGLNEENELRVVTLGKIATVYINGARTVAFEGDAPQGGSLIGLHGESGSTPYAWKFSDFSVRKLSPESAEKK